MSTLLNLSEQLKNVEFMPRVENAEEVGRYAIEHYEDYEIPHGLERFIDYEGFGEFYVSSHEGGFVSKGFVAVTDFEIPVESIGKNKE